MVSSEACGAHAGRTSARDAPLTANDSHRLDAFSGESGQVRSQPRRAWRKRSLESRFNLGDGRLVTVGGQQASVAANN